MKDFTISTVKLSALNYVIEGQIMNILETGDNILDL